MLGLQDEYLSLMNFLRRLVAQSYQETVERKEGAKHGYYPRGMDSLEASQSCVFDGAPPRISSILQAFKEEELWCLAGAQGLQTLGLDHGLG